MAADALLFDLDGTLWDSHPWYALVAGESHPRRAREIVQHLRAGGNVVTLLRARGVSRTGFLHRCGANIDRLVLYEGVVETLDRLAIRGVRLGSVTNLPAWLAEPMLVGSGLASLFATNKWAARKPSPASLLTAARVLREHGAATVVYVGDTENDADAASAAKLPFAWAGYGYGEREPAGALTVLRSFKEVLDL